MSKEYLNKICGNPNYSDHLIVGPFADLGDANAWAAANPSSLFPGLLATAGGVQYRWSGSAWVAIGGDTNKSVVLSAMLGDSIVAQYSSCVVQASAKLGEIITINAAVGGTKIEAQAVQIPAIVASGAKKVYIQVGTNNLGDAPNVLYGKYVSLFKALIAENLTVVAVFIPPRSSAYSALIYKCNNAMYYAAKLLGISTFDPWSQFALEAGGWSVATVASDNTHPVPSVRATAANTLASQIMDGLKAFPIVRTRSDSAVSNACFAVDSTSKGIADGWVTEVSGAPVFSLESDGSNGQKWQVITLTNPSTGDYGNIKQAVTTGFSSGDTMVFRGNLSMDTADTVDDKCFASVQVRFLTAGSATISSVYANNALKQSIGVSNFECKFVVPPLTATIEIIVGPYCWSASTGAFVTRVSRVGLVNLTSLAIPA